MSSVTLSSQSKSGYEPKQPQVSNSSSPLAGRCSLLWVGGTAAVAVASAAIYNYGWMGGGFVLAAGISVYALQRTSKPRLEEKASDPLPSPKAAVVPKPSRKASCSFQAEAPVEAASLTVRGVDVQPEHVFRENPRAPESLDARSIGIQARQWVDSHEEEFRPMLRRIGRSMQLISYNKFVQQLGRTTESLCEILRSQNPSFDPLKDAVVLIEGEKSNKWVAELACRHCDFAGSFYYRLGDKDAWALATYLNADPQHAEQARREFKGKTIVLFDDGSYSGKQIVDHLRALDKIIKAHRLQVNGIALAIPYMTSYARDRIEAYIGSRRQDAAPIFLARSTQIPTLAEGLTVEGDEEKTELYQKTLADMWYQGNRNHLQTVGLFLFDHKIPNSQSFPEAMARGIVMVAAEPAPNPKQMASKKEMKKKEKPGSALQASRTFTSRPKPVRFIPEVIPPYRG